jgi:hypothetical protein
MRSKPKSTTSYRKTLRRPMNETSGFIKELVAHPAVPLKMEAPREVPADEAYLRDRKDK